MKPLYNHTSEETAYVVSDYPYGFKLRTSIRYWIENGGHNKGFRFCSQTLNPKNGRWNAPKKGTYDRLGSALLLNEENGHVEAAGIGIYSNDAEVLKFIQNYPGWVDKDLLLAWCVSKAALTTRLSRGEAVFSHNGIPAMPGLSEIEDAKEECEGWKKCINELKSLISTPG